MLGAASQFATISDGVTPITSRTLQNTTHQILKNYPKQVHPQNHHIRALQIENLSVRYEEVLELCEGVMRDLLDLENIRLAGKRQKISESSERTVMSDAKVIWDEMEENYADLNRFCDASLDRFHRQAMLQSGATTKKGSLSTLHQGISSQVCVQVFAIKHIDASGAIDHANSKEGINKIQNASF